MTALDVESIINIRYGINPLMDKGFRNPLVKGYF
jgi:hypothetical protein